MPIPPLPQATDLVILVGTVAAILLIGAALLQRRFATLHSRSERYCLGGIHAFLWLCALVAFGFVFGYVGLLKLNLVTPLWTFYSLFYLLGRVAVVWLFPVIALGFCLWAASGLLFRSYTRRTLRFAVASAGLALLDFLIYAALELEATKVACL